MVKINFKKLPCYVDIRKASKMELDLCFDFSNAMYLKGHGIEMCALAMKIYNAKGEVEFSDKECDLILRFASTISPFVYESLSEIIKKED